MKSKNTFELKLVNNSYIITNKFLDKIGFVKYLVICKQKNEFYDSTNKLIMNTEKIVYLKQVHGSNYYDVNNQNYKDIINEEGDALITSIPGLTLGIYTADCVPIVLVDIKRKRISAIHAGWKGTYKKITSKVIDYLIYSGSDENDIFAFIGPSIGPCCFEVSDNVGEKFSCKKKINDKIHVDLWQENKLQLLNKGILESNIYSCDICTFCNSDFLYSYRKEGKNTGRIRTYIQIIEE